MMSQNYKSKNFSLANQKLSEITQLQTLESVSRSAIVKHLLKKLNSLKAVTKFFELYCSKLQKFGIFFVPEFEKNSESETCGSMVEVFSYDFQNDTMKILV